MFKIYLNIVILTILISGACFADISFSLDSIDPEPNYFKERCEDCLIDGDVVGRFKLDKAKVVGWKYRNPLTIKYNINNVKSDFVKTSIHILSNEKVGAHPPASISIYGSRDGRNYEFLNSIVLLNKIWSGADWIDLEHEVLGGDYILVIHASKKLVFIDEVRSVELKSVSMNTKNNKYVLEPEIPGDSLMRLAKSRSKEKFNFSKTIVEIISPWFDETRSGSNLLESNRINNLQYSSVIGGKLYICIKISSDRDQKFDFEYDKSKNLKLYQLREVVSSDAKKVMDKIVPLQNDYFLVDKDSVFYLWLEIEPDKVIDDVYNFSLSSGKEAYQYNVRIDNNIINDVEYDSSLIVWGYTLDRPIWKDKYKAVDLLSGAGVNVFTIHPNLVPRVNASFSAKMTLRNELEFFKGKGESLLFLAWKPKRNPFLKYMDHEYNLNLRGMSLLSDWLNQISGVVDSLEFERNDWALYITDEPNNEEATKFVIRMAEQIKALDNTIRLYINPDLSRYSRRDQDVYMNGIIKSFDIVQMTMEYIYGSGERYLNEGDVDWRVYDLPSYPPKSASPLLNYKLPFFKAAKVDVTGVGIWSFSSVNGPTATSDIDEFSPDWAMVYEGNEELVRSRRWEALVDGYNDFKLFGFLKNNNKSCVTAYLDEIILEKNSSRLYEIGNTYRQHLNYMCGSTKIIEGQN